jgi:hypothetical protein
VTGLPASVCIWLASREADFLQGRLLWANWDVEELKERKQEIIERNLLTIILNGFTFEAYNVLTE